MVFINYQNTIKILTLDPIENVQKAHTALHIFIFSSTFHFNLIALSHPTDCSQLVTSPLFCFPFTAMFYVCPLLFL